MGVLVAAGWTSPAWAQTRIACVGDSITAGYGVAADEAYPVVLQGLFDAEQYEVGNFGFSGATLMKSGNTPYWSTGEYTASGAFEPNVVVLMLGTNDGKAANWANSSQFDADYTELVTHYRDLGATVYVAVPPPVFEPGAFEIVPQLVNEEVSAHVRALAVELDAPLIDVFAAFEAQAALFPDKVHPNAEGARQLAQVMFDALQQGQAEPMASSSGSDVEQGAAGAGGNEQEPGTEQGGAGAAPAGSGGADSPPLASSEQGQAGAPGQPSTSASGQEPTPPVPTDSLPAVSTPISSTAPPGTSSPTDVPTAPTTSVSSTPTATPSTTDGTASSATRSSSEPSPASSMPTVKSEDSASDCGCRAVGRRSTPHAGVDALAFVALALSLTRRSRPVLAASRASARHQR